MNRKLSQTELPALDAPIVVESPKKRVAIWIACGLIALAGGAFVASKFLAKHDEAPAKRAVLTVTTEPVKVIVAERHLDVSGSIWPSDPISIGSEINGLRVTSVNAEEGQFVHKGQVLATLNSSILRAQLAQQQARLKQMQAAFSKAKQPNRSFEIAGVKFAHEQARAVISQEEANVQRAKAALENARKLSTRYNELSRQGAVSTQDADTTRSQELIAEADLRNAEQKLAAAKAAAVQAHQRMSMFIEGGRSEDIEIAAATMAETKAMIQQISSQIAQTIIRAPADGLITKRDVHIGDIGTAMQTRAFFTMIRDNKLELRAQVPESDLPRLREGQTVLFTSPMGTNFQGVISIITPQVDPDTRLATLRISIPYAHDLRPGIFIHGIVKLASEQVPVIPTKAVTSRDDYNIVYTLEGDKALARNIRLGDRFGDYVEVLSGLKVGEPVISSGAGFLKDGAVVRVTNGGGIR